MNLDELKPLWESYQEQTEERYHWSSADFEHLLERPLQPIAWYGRFSGVMINVCMSLLLITLTGC